LVLEVDLAQDNNNASVQVNGGQNNINAMVFSNIASSASNIAQNVADISDLAGVDLVSQSNVQTASNYSESSQTITNSGTIFASVSIAQDNNNASVQLNGAQNDSSGMILENSVASASNVGQNIASVYNPIGLTDLEQVNDQEAYNEFDNVDQTVTNDISVAQDNNNGSIQANESQNGSSSMITLNTAVSAVNAAWTG